MTTEKDLSSGTSGKRDQPGSKSPARTSPSSEIRMNMPDQNSGKKASGGGSPQSIERLLLKLMGRIDENDRHYGEALAKLNDRLNTLSQRAQSASTSSPAGSAAALERVHEQASSLAAQVNDAGTAHKAQQSTPANEFEQRLSTLSRHLEGGTPRGESSAVGDDFADVTQRLERSLSTGAPSGEFDTLTNRMDDLAHQLDSALETRNDPGRLQSIEARLEQLAAGFANAQQHYARIEGIERHLHSLMNWTQSAGAPANDSNMIARLDAIERALQALNNNAGAMDDQAGLTLEALNEAMEPPASHAGLAPGPRAAQEEQHIETETPDPQQSAGEPYDTGDYADVWIDENPDADTEPEPQRSRSRPAPASDELGSSIPDYQPGPAISRDARPGEMARNAGRRSQRPDRAEPAFEADNDFIASARRAAAAAAAQVPEPEAKAGAFRTPRAGPVPVEPVDAAPSGSKRPRPFFVAAAVGLLLVSAGILFGQLRTKPEALGPSSIGQIAPQPPSTAPGAPAANTNQRSSLPAAAPESEKLQSRPKAPVQGQPTSTERTAPAATPETAPATHANYSTTTPAAEAPPVARRPLSTATLLASLSQEAVRDPLPGVQVTIKDPPEHAPAPRTRTTAPIAAPALVPSAAPVSRPDPLALPKRAPAAPGKHANLQTQPIDSAPATSLSQPMPSRSTAMPPVRIGPQSLRVAAARGNPAAQVEVASRFAKGTGVAKNLKKAAEWYKRAAAQGFAPAQYRLAALFERGLGVKQDVALAQSWYRRAAELGNIRAMHNLAVLHTRANPKRPDYTAAKNWFHEAARRGLADSQFNLGVLYESGLGVTRNAAEAYKWFTLAARQGDDEARKRREAIRPRLPARSLSAVERTLRSWKPAKVNDAANRSGKPRGGWRKAELPKAAKAIAPARVARAQKLLNKLGYDAGVPDGKLGPQTITAIRRFEDRTGAAKSGRVTPTLLRKLEALSG